MIGSFGANRAMEAETKRLARRAIAGWREIRPERRDEQTLSYPFDPELAWMACNYLRTPSRVVWDLFAAKSKRLEPLYEELCKWLAKEERAWLGDGLGVSVRVVGANGVEAGELQIQGTVKNAILDSAHKKGIEMHLQPDDPDVLITARGDPLIISIDLAGRSMHERGYRFDHGEAPLRENLAAQLLILSRWDARSEALIDPLCGSGTIPLEAALMARGEPLWIPPRAAAARRLPLFADRAKSKPSDLFPGHPPPIFGSDLDRNALKSARSNARRAGAGDRVTFEESDFRDLNRAHISELFKKPLEKGLILTNPPYGERLGEDQEEIEALYADLWEWVESFGAGFRVAFLTANPALEELTRRVPVLKKPIRNGPLKGYFLVYELG